MSMKVKPNFFSSNPAGVAMIKQGNGRPYTVRNKRDRFFFPDEWMAFYDALKDGKQKITFKGLINTGARINELRNVKVKDIDFERGSIVLRITKRTVSMPVAKRIEMRNAGIPIKGVRKIRIISISSEFASYLKKVVKEYRLKPEDWLPVLSSPASHLSMKKALRKAGFNDWQMFSVHNVRKTLETWLLALDIDSFKVIKHFGHSGAIALKHYMSPDIFNYQDKTQMRQIIGDLFRK